MDVEMEKGTRSNFAVDFGDNWSRLEQLAVVD
jgi:hypothetical protein